MNISVVLITKNLRGFQLSCIFTLPESLKSGFIFIYTPQILYHFYFVSKPMSTLFLFCFLSSDYWVSPVSLRCFQTTKPSQDPIFLFICSLGSIHFSSVSSIKHQAKGRPSAYTYFRINFSILPAWKLHNLLVAWPTFHQIEYDLISSLVDNHVLRWLSKSDHGLKSWNHGLLHHTDSFVSVFEDLALLPDHS